MRPILVLNPRHDDTFAESADRALDDGGSTPAELQRRLRMTYPEAVVRARTLVGERLAIWYAYRDGRWVNGAAHEEERVGS